MRVLFDPDFDAGAWPGPRGERAAVAGEAWLGCDGLLRAIETALGLQAPHASAADRAAALVPRLFREDRFYGASARADPWATANRLLAWRDDLWERGWRGEAAGERRLGELAEVTLGLPAGAPERLETAAGWLQSRGAGIEEVALVAPRASLSPAWRRVLAGLEAQGTAVRERPLADAPASGNLAAVRAPGAIVAGPDATLQLVRPHGPREAARSLAAALAADPMLEETLFIGADGILDEALAEMGLPTLGAPLAHDAGSLAELLPLTVQLAWAPVDPQLALDWLTLPDLPLPRALAARLCATLAEWPAVGNPEWMRAEQAAFEREPEGAEAARAVLTAVFSPVAHRSGRVAVRDLAPRLDLLERWASERAAGSAAHEQVRRQVRALRGRLRRAELSKLTPPRLDAVLASVTGEASAPRRPALAGFAAVGEPGSVAGPARRVVWWGFTGKGSARRPGVALRGSEARALAGLGVEMPAPGAEVRHAAMRARRPLGQATGALVLVAPRHDETGEPSHPHPLWDEITSLLADPRAARHLVTSAPRLPVPAARVAVPVALPGAPARAVRTSLRLVPRAAESPTSLEKLLGCSFAYAVEQAGRLRRRTISLLSASSRLLGKLAHEALAEVARRDLLRGEEPRREAAAILQELLPSHAALLLLPGQQQELLALREAVGRAAELLGRVVTADRLRVLHVEERLAARVGPRQVIGTPDLVLADPAGRLVLLDFKWSGETYRRDQLRSGGALQLAAYAAMLGEAGAAVRSLGYLVVQSGRLLVRGEALSFAQRVRPELLEETWAAALRSWDERDRQLAAGELFAEGIAEAGHAPADEALVQDGRLVVPPPCGFCALSLLCGRGQGAA